LILTISNPRTYWYKYELYFKLLNKDVVIFNCIKYFGVNKENPDSFHFSIKFSLSYFHWWWSQRDLKTLMS